MSDHRGIVEIRVHVGVFFLSYSDVIYRKYIYRVQNSQYYTVDHFLTNVRRFYVSLIYFTVQMGNL